ncbi:hypothetical protein V6N11_071517 [Hibiscus sabdariffa]|uniref:Transposase-associated domain-containing protein n=1 Tax=Hibiscus sabdariffa TaxID=183260 RepID=A0ABR2U0J4_9ROSI
MKVLNTAHYLIVNFFSSSEAKPVGIMDRNWMSHRNRFSPEYQEGVRDFLNLAKQNTDSSGRIRCPCKDCHNCLFKKIADVKFDLFKHGFAEDYTRWTHHGESFQPSIDQLCDLNDNDHNSDEVQLGHDDMFEMLDGIQKSTFVETNTERSSMNTETTESEGEVEKFRKLLNDAQRELYPGYVEENVSDLASNHEPYQQFEPDSNDVRQINIETNESLNQETEVDEIDSSLLSSKSGSMSNEGAIHASLSDEEEDHDYYDDDTITNYFDDGVGVCEQEEEEL